MENVGNIENHPALLDKHSPIVPLLVFDFHNDAFHAGPNSHSRDYLLNYWKEGAIIADKFWEKWQTQYLQTLRDRKQREHKGPHAQTKRIPQVEEIVLVRTGAVPRGCWPLARITKLIAQAGNIRAAQLKMSNGYIWERPLNHLYPLELSISQNKQYQVVDPNIELEDNEDEEKLPIRPRFGWRKTMPKS
uniref:DUF5641 domain-containing protein n=1 Tax=Wuchereria bancrofti TaxID=6293 RepID=A0A1I8EXF9_WUCBA